LTATPDEGTSKKVRGQTKGKKKNSLLKEEHLYNSGKERTTGTFKGKKRGGDRDDYVDGKTCNVGGKRGLRRIQ